MKKILLVLLFATLLFSFNENVKANNQVAGNLIVNDFVFENVYMSYHFFRSYDNPIPAGLEDIVLYIPSNANFAQEHGGVESLITFNDSLGTSYNITFGSPIHLQVPSGASEFSIIVMTTLTSSGSTSQNLQILLNNESYVYSEHYYGMVSNNLIENTFTWHSINMNGTYVYYHRSINNPLDGKVVSDIDLIIPDLDYFISVREGFASEIVFYDDESNAILGYPITTDNTNYPIEVPLNAVSFNIYIVTTFTSTGAESVAELEKVNEGTFVFTLSFRDYSVVFYDWDDTILKTQTVLYGQNATPPTEPIRTGYNFTGWDTDYTNITQDTNVTATYSINEYLVRFFDWNGTLLKSELVEYGNSATPPLNPTRDGYEFIGWDSTYDNITANKDINAVYSINEYNVNFYDWDNTLLSAQIINHGDSALAPVAPTRAGYEFIGWSDSFNVITGDKDIYAVYDINSYTVTFYDWDNTVLKVESVNYGDSATAPSSPIRTGYTFDTWDVPYNNITNDLDVTALYDINSYTVTFYDWDNTVLKIESVEYGSNATSPANPTRENFNFTGWDTSFDSITQDTNVTATYSATEYLVRFIDWDDTILKSELVEGGNDATPPVDPTRIGYTFTGWNGVYTNITENTDIYATYDINTFTVRFYSHSGTLLSTQIIDYGGDAIPPTPPLREGYVFDEWNQSYINITTNKDLIALYVEIPIGNLLADSFTVYNFYMDYYGYTSNNNPINKAVTNIVVYIPYSNAFVDSRGGIVSRIIFNDELTTEYVIPTFDTVYEFEVPSGATNFQIIIMSNRTSQGQGTQYDLLLLNSESYVYTDYYNQNIEGNLLVNDFTWHSVLIDNTRVYYHRSHLNPIQGNIIETLEIYIPTTEYYSSGISGFNTRITYYDEDNVYITTQDIPENTTNFAFNVPNNAKYFSLFVVSTLTVTGAESVDDNTLLNNFTAVYVNQFTPAPETNYKISGNLFTVPFVAINYYENVFGIESNDNLISSDEMGYIILYLPLVGSPLFTDGGIDSLIIFNDANNTEIPFYSFESIQAFRVPSGATSYTIRIMVDYNTQDVGIQNMLIAYNQETTVYSAWNYIESNEIDDIRETEFIFEDLGVTYGFVSANNSINQIATKYVIFRTPFTSNILPFNNGLDSIIQFYDGVTSLDYDYVTIGDYTVVEVPFGADNYTIQLVTNLTSGVEVDNTLTLLNETFEIYDLGFEPINYTLYTSNTPIFHYDYDNLTNQPIKINIQFDILQPLGQFRLQRLNNSGEVVSSTILYVVDGVIEHTFLNVPLDGYAYRVYDVGRDIVLHQGFVKRTPEDIYNLNQQPRLGIGNVYYNNFTNETINAQEILHNRTRPNQSLFNRSNPLFIYYLTHDNVSNPSNYSFILRNQTTGEEYMYQLNHIRDLVKGLNDNSYFVVMPNGNKPLFVNESEQWFYNLYDYVLNEGYYTYHILNTQTDTITSYGESFFTLTTLDYNTKITTTTPTIRERKNVVWQLSTNPIMSEFYTNHLFIDDLLQQDFSHLITESTFSTFSINYQVLEPIYNYGRVRWTSSATTLMYYPDNVYPIQVAENYSIEGVANLQGNIDLIFDNIGFNDRNTKLVVGVILILATIVLLVLKKIPFIVNVIIVFLSIALLTFIDILPIITLFLTIIGIFGFVVIKKLVLNNSSGN